MSALGSLVVKLALEYAQFTQGLDKNEQAALKNAQNVQQAYDKMANAVEDRYQSLKSSIANTVAGAVSIAGLMSVASKIRTETINAEKEQAQLAAALRSTGEAAGWSQEQLNDMASAMSKATTYSAGEINQAQARLLAYVNITGEQVPRAVRAAMDMSTRLEMNLNQSMETVAKALDKPSTGMQSLQRQGFKFTEAQIEMAKALENSGRLADAQAIVFAELESSYGGAAEAARDTLGGALTAVGNTINDLLTADSASLPALRNSVEELNTLLQSESSRSAFAFYVQLMVDTAHAAARLGVALADLRNGGMGTLLGHATSGNAASELVEVESKLNKLRSDSVTLDPSAGLRNKLNEVVFGDYADIQRQIGLLEGQREVLLRSTTVAGALGNTYESLADSNDALVASLNGTTEAARGQGEVVGRTDAYLRKYGTAAQKAAIEIAELKAKLGDAFTPEMEAKIRAVYAKQDEGAKASAQSAKHLATAYSHLINSIDDKIGQQRLELATGEALNDADKLRIKFQLDLDGSLRGLTAAQRAYAASKLDELEKLIKENEARKKAAELLSEERKFRQEWLAAQARTVEELDAGNKKLSEEIELIGLSAAEQAAVLRRREEAIILIKEQQLAELQLAEDAQQHMSQRRILLEQEIALRRENLALTSTKASREYSAAATAASVEEWNRGIEQIGQSLTDQLMAGGKSFGDYLRNLARTLAFRPIIMATVQGGMNAVGLGPLQAGATSTGGLFDLIGAGRGLLGDSSMKGLAGSFSAGMQGGWAGFEGGISMMQNGSLWAGGAQALGAAAPYLGGLFQLAQGNYGAGAGTMAGAYIGSIVPGIGTAIGAALGSVLGGLLDGLDDSGTPHLGAAARYSDGATREYREGMPADAWVDQTYTAISTLTTALGRTLDDTAKTFGKKAGYEIITAFSDDSSKDGAFGALYVKGPDGKNIVDWSGYDSKWGGRWFSDGDAGYQEYLLAMANDVKAAFKAMDLPGWANQLLDGAKGLDGINAALQQIGATKALFDSWAKSMEMFAGLTGELQTQLLQASGGLEALASNVGAFYENFYSEDERMAIANDQITRAIQDLGYEINPYVEGSKQVFKELVRAAMDSGQVELASKLLAMSGSFAQAADYAARAAEEAAKKAKESADAAIKQKQDAAWSNLQAALDRERQYWSSIEQAAQATVSQLSGTLGMLTSNARELYGTVETTQQMLAAQGMVYIEETLSAVRRGASIADYDNLQDAINAARSGIAEGVFATAAEREREALVLAGQLSDLGDLTDVQLGVQERQLKAAQSQIEQLDKTLDYWRQQVDGTNKLIDVHMTLAEAIARMEAAYNAKNAPATPSNPGKTGGSGGATFGGSGGGDFSGSDTGGVVWGAAPSSPDGRTYVDLAAGKRTYGDGSVEYLTPDEIHVMQLQQQGWTGVPMFASGGLHSGGIRLVGENGPELEVTGPSRIFNAQQTQQLLSGMQDGGGADLRALIQLLIPELQKLGVLLSDIGKAVSGLPQLVDQTDTVTEGGNGMRAEIMNVEALAQAIVERMNA